MILGTIGKLFNALNVRLMGTKASTSSEEVLSSVVRQGRCRVLGIHGWRTSAKILMGQTGALRYHTGIDLDCIDSPWEATGPPDDGIAMVYPDQPYYQWFVDSAEGRKGLPESLSLISSALRSESAYEGMLGFSQGAGMCTLSLQHFRSLKPDTPAVKFVILIGGVEPASSDPSIVGVDDSPLDIPSLHIIGQQDALKHRAERLLQYYEPSKRTVLYHEEGHNIPSMRTQLYPTIRTWIEEHR